MALNPTQLIGESPAFHWLMDRVSDAAVLNKPILVVGERGTGKELIASRLHFLSPRWEKTYIHVNCAAFSDEAIDTNLFGRVFFDSRTDIDGQFIRAEGGTLFLDNIESLSLRMQEKLLQALDYGYIDPAGSSETQDIDVRLIASTAIDLPRAVKEGHFRADLLDHLSFDVLTLPPLQARRQDIPALAEYFGKKQAIGLGAERFPGFTPEALNSLAEQDWPGNIRELKTVVERTVGRAFLEDETLSNALNTIALNPFDSLWPIREPQRPTYAPSQSSAPLNSTNRFANNAAHQIHDENTNAHPNLDLRTDKSDLRHTSPENAGSNQTNPNPAAPEGFSDRVMVFERRLIDEALRLGENHQGKAAEYLDLSYHQFRGLLRKHGLKK